MYCRECRTDKFCRAYNLLYLSQSAETFVILRRWVQYTTAYVQRSTACEQPITRPFRPLRLGHSNPTNVLKNPQILKSFLLLLICTVCIGELGMKKWRHQKWECSKLRHSVQIYDPALIRTLVPVIGLMFTLVNDGIFWWTTGICTLVIGLAKFANLCKGVLPFPLVNCCTIRNIKICRIPSRYPCLTIFKGRD